MDSIKVGDIFVDSWGYDQTNIDFYKVTKKMNKSVKRGQCSVTVVPDPDHVIGEEMTKLPKDGWIRTKSFSRACPWNGEPLEETACGYGH